MFQTSPFFPVKEVAQQTTQNLFLKGEVLLVFYLLGLAIILAILFLIIRQILRREAHLLPSFQNIVLLIQLPKEAASREEEKEKELKEIISVAETMYANLAGAKPARGLATFLYGRQDHLSLEIVAQKGLIKFFVVVPRCLEHFVEQQIHAQYHEAQIEEVEDYNIFTPQAVIKGASLVFAKNSFFPLKTYKELESDPLNALTNTLSKLGEDEGAAIQILIRSAKKGALSKGLKIAREIQQGKKLEEVLRGIGGSKILSGAGELLFGLGGTISQGLSTQKKEKSLESYQSQKPREKEPYRLSPLEEEIVKSLEEKASSPLFEANIRVVVSSDNKEFSQSQLQNIINSFSQYNAGARGNAFKKAYLFWSDKLISEFIFRKFVEAKRIILSASELTSLYHFPHPFIETPNILWLKAKKAPAPVNISREGLILGRNIYRGEEREIRIKPDDRRRHIYIIGMTGSGKSTLLANMACQDIKNGEGVGVIDPHGSLVEDILENIPEERVEDVIYFDPSDIERPIGLNMLEAKREEAKDFAVQEMISIFYKLFPPEMIGPIFEHNMRNVMLTLMADQEYPGTIVEIPRMFTDPEFQKYKLKKVTDPVVRAFWEKEMAKTTEFHKSETLGYLISKVGRFIENAMIRNIIGQPHSGFDIPEIMNKGQILLVNLSKGKVGEVNSSLLGLIITSKLQMAAMGRVYLPEKERRDFYLYIDEFQNYITDSIATILSEARKYRLNLTLAHQYIGQLVQGQDTKIRDAVFGNVGTIISFRIGVEDAEIMAREFAPVFGQYDVINIDRFNAYVKLLIDNAPSRAFNMEIYPPRRGDSKRALAIRELSRLKYGRDRKIVEREILEHSRLGEAVSQVARGEGEKIL